MTTFIKGTQAIVVGSIYAGCDAFFGYPITPASDVSHTAAAWFPALGREFLQAECETASISMLFGAAAAGKLSMTATSGPGMSLMQEGISYMAGAELPGVIVNVQRAGPGLGNIYPEQADYNQAVKGGGHGSYHCIVLAPDSVQELCDLTIMAFDMSLRYRTPAIVLSDGVVALMMESLKMPTQEARPASTADWAVQGTAETRKNLVTSIFLTAKMQEDHNIHLQAKYDRMRSEARYQAYMLEDAEIILVGYGIAARIAHSAVDALRRRGVRAGLFRPITLFPFAEGALRELAGNRPVAVVEHSAGQFRDDVAMYLGRHYADVPLIHRMGGILVSVEQAVAAVESILQGHPLPPLRMADEPFVSDNDAPPAYPPPSGL